MRNSGRWFLIMGVLWALFACSDNDSGLYTVDGIGPDKWVSAWLLQRVEGNRQPVHALASYARTDKGLWFDVDQSKFRRDGASIAARKVLDHYNINDQFAIELVSLVEHIETNRWDLGENEEAAQLESAYRSFYKNYSTSSGYEHCFLEFFQAAYEMLDTSNRLEGFQYHESNKCRRAHKLPVITIDTDGVLEAINSDKQVVFIDTREPEEYEEYRIPGSINRRLSEIDDEFVDEIKNADLVVPYCVKDFRGYELARKLADNGLNNVAIMKPYGVKGWRTMKLPIVKGELISHSSEYELLKRCMKDRQQCQS